MVFIANEEVISQSGTFNTPGRLGGLVELFRVLTLENGRFTTDDEVLKNIFMISEETSFQNKTDWKPYADELKRKAIDFMRE